MDLPFKIVHLASESATDRDYENHPIAEINDHVIRISVMTEAYQWHCHPDSDEIFLALEGGILIDLANGAVELKPGNMFTVVRGARHRTRPLGSRSVNLTFERADAKTVMLAPPGNRTRDLLKCRTGEAALSSSVDGATTDKSVYRYLEGAGILREGESITITVCSCSNLMKSLSHNSFPNSHALGEWMADNHASAKELWVRIYKAGSGQPSVTWADCVVEAIRYGWIDGQKKPLDDSLFLQRLSPRKPGSNWSSKNREHAKKLIQEGRMAPAGLAHVEAAQKDGRWEKAYAGSADMEIPEDFLTALNKLPRAKKFFATLNRQNLFSIYYRLHSAKKPETRAKRMTQILSMLDNERKLH